MKVLKFGGVSVGSVANIRRIADIYRSDAASIRAIIVSAFNGVTDQLLRAGAEAGAGNDQYKAILEEIEKRHLEAVDELIPAVGRARIVAQVKATLIELEDVLKGSRLVGECTARTKDYIASFGERLSAYVIAEAFCAQGLDAEYLDARTVIRTDRQFGSAQVDFAKSNSLIRDYFNNHPKLQLVTGFIAATERGETTVLGRGGSDYTAAILGAGLDADEIEIWTDVSGVMTADPRHVPRALSIGAITYAEAAELSHFGAKVIYPPTIQPARAKSIVLRRLGPASNAGNSCSFSKTWA